MSTTEKLRVITYDISLDKIRRRVAYLLEQEATRVQYSVFEARLTKHSVQKLIRKLDNLLQDGDSLRIYTIGKTGERQCTVLGDGIPVEKGAGYWLL